MPKNIILLSDGTGNSASKLFKTNVWRLYQALDLSCPDPVPPGKQAQIAYHDDGVGTAAFKPLALFGGAFGWGLKRNVLDLYSFLCRHYEPGDRIYGFGFSRGAFTIRILTALVISQGLVTGFKSESELKRCAQGAFRAYRNENYKRTIFHKFFRWLRDSIIWMWNKLLGRSNYDPGRERLKPDIRFLGLWDTVAAYGLPFDELTQAWNAIFPLSFSNRNLSAKVKRACHALALDDERHSFHPLLWNEKNEDRKTRIREEHLTQVWFAGMHTNVGGGYPDDSMSSIPLDWIVGEAEHADLVFKDAERKAIRDAANVNGKMYDSRKGVGGAYRYSPRKLDNFTKDLDDSKKKGQEPNEVIIDRPKIHESVFERIRNGVDGYAPIGLPREYAVVTRQGDILELAQCAEQGITLFEHPEQAKNRANRQEEVWNLVWWKRRFYFLSVVVFFLIAFFPLYCQMTSIGPARLRFLSPIIAGIGGFLPDFLNPWFDAFQSYPDQFAVLLLSLSILVFLGSRLQRTLFDGMQGIWKSSLKEAAALPNDLIYKLRSHRWYQPLVRFVKRKLLPPIVGVLAIVAIVVGLWRGVFWLFNSSGN